MKKFVSMVLCLSIFTTTPLFSMDKEDKNALIRLGMKSIRSDLDYEQFNDEEKKLAEVIFNKFKKRDEEKAIRKSSIHKNKKEKEDDLIFGVFPAGSTVNFLLGATICCIVYMIFTTPWSGPGARVS